MQPDYRSGGTEYMVRGRGSAKSVADFESIVVSGSDSGTPIRIRDIGHVTEPVDHGHDTPSGDARAASAAGCCPLRARFISTCHFQIS
jgi:Cu(I)/Ag(I) efflux system membrane protein CusA/SilA